MSVAFIIMQIGDSELDEVCEQAIVPALEACGFDAKRVDKHNKGGLLKSEIISFIQEAEIIVADLTNERPNCYLEVGYAMGIDKFPNLILTVREDHFPESPQFKKGGPKIHFDLAGYDILSWDKSNLDIFRSELENRIRRRKVIVDTKPAQGSPTLDKDWIERHRDIASSGLHKSGLPGSMEITFALEPPKPDFSQAKLDDASRTATVDTFGWPIGVYLGNREEFKPKPRTDGIVAEIPLEDRSSYDYWALRRSGDFYSLSSLFEDRTKPGYLYFNTRIVRATEALLYCARLYARLGIDRASRVSLSMQYGGLKGRKIASSNPLRLMHDDQAECMEDSVGSTVDFKLEAVESNLVQLVMDLTKPLLVLFDYFEPADSIFQDIVNRFVNGEVA